jgi:hypothetical protein
MMRNHTMNFPESSRAVLPRQYCVAAGDVGLSASCRPASTASACRSIESHRGQRVASGNVGSLHDVSVYLSNLQAVGAALQLGGRQQSHHLNRDEQGE